MVTALFKIDVATLSAGVSDTSRIDGVPNQLVTLTYTGAGASAYAWRFWDYQGAQTVPTITNDTTSVATFTPSGGASGYGQSFGIELTVDSTIVSRRVYKIPTLRENFLIPIFAERADPAAALYNQGAGPQAISTDNAASNAFGYAKRMTSFMQTVERLVGRLTGVLRGPVIGTAETIVGSINIPVGTIITLQVEMGCGVPTDSAVLKLYRQADNTLLATLAPGAGGLALASATNITVANEGVYEFRGYCSNNISGVAIFNGYLADMR